MLQILLEDTQILAVGKPAGLLTQGLPGREPTLEDRARAYLGGGGDVYLGVVHRLDRPVSGVVLWAKSPKAARRLAGQFERRETVKEYAALVTPRADSPPPRPGDEGVWEDWLAESTDADGLVRVVTPDAPKARLARTRYRVESAEPGAPARLTLWPETGRTHQIRVQAAARGWPVAGDARYGSDAPGPAPGVIALHARSLTFRHPTLDTPTTVVAPWPEGWG